MSVMTFAYGVVVFSSLFSVKPHSRYSGLGDLFDVIEFRL